MSDAWADIQHRLAQHWWAFGLRGVIAIAFGVIAFVMPGITIVFLLGLFAAYMAIDGILAMTAAARAMRQHDAFWPFLLEGIADILAAAIALIWPGVTVIALIYLAAIWAFVSGALLIAGAARMTHQMDGRWLLILNGAFSTIWGALLFVWPIAGLLVLTWWLGAYAIVFGFLLLVMAYRLRHMLPPAATAAAA